MAKSRFEYVKNFELDDTLLPSCWIVIRLDGKGFTKFSEQHKFEKPNDVRSLDLMTHAAKEVVKLFSDVRLAYGESDEYSFVLRKETMLYEQPLKSIPIFDGRAVCYPTDAILRDYLAWRQADTHINNQYNTCFWALIQQDGKTPAEAQKLLKGTSTGDKNEILWQHKVNYQLLPEQFRKGTTIIRQRQMQVVKHQADGTPVERLVMTPLVLHEDIISDTFWEQYADVLL